MALAGITRRRRVPLPAPRPRRRALRATRTRWAQAIIEAAARPASASPCSTRATCTAGTGGDRSTGVQRRFGDGDADAWAAAGRPAGARRGRRSRIGAAIHSVRAVDPAAQATRGGVGGRRATRRCTRTCPSSRPRTRRASPAYGRTPTALLADAGALSDRVHRGARHPRLRRRHRPARRGARVRAASARRPSATSPTASARRAALRDAGVAARARHRFARGDRPVRGGAGRRARRAARSAARAGTHTARELLAAATAAGYASLGWPDGGRIAPGALGRPRDRRARRRPPRGHRPATRSSTRSCSPAPPPTCATWSSAAASSCATARHVDARRRRASCATRSRRCAR